MALSVLAGLFLLAAADKPSPFAVKKTESPVPMTAPVPPVVRPVRPPAAAASGVTPAVAPVPVVLPKVIRPEKRATPLLQQPPADVAASPATVEAAGQDRIKRTEPIVVEVEDKAPPLQDVRLGMPKDDVMAALGRAATRISMYDGADYIEVLRYEWKGQWAGSVRLSNGKVIKIDKPR